MEQNHKEYIQNNIPQDIQLNEIINVFNILFKQGLITQQEQLRATDLINRKYKK